MPHWLIKILILTIITLLAWVILLASSRAEEMPDYQEDLRRVEFSILYIVQNGFPKHKIKPHPRHLIAQDAEKRRELAEAIVKAGRRWNIPPLFLVTMAFREGSFDNNAEGAIGERTTFQMVSMLTKRLKCDTKTYAGAADCAAQWLHFKRKECGHLRGAFLRYATGRKICKADTAHLRWIVWDRFGITAKLEKLPLSSSPL